MKLKDDILLEQAYSTVLEEAKKKVNPWAVCNSSTGGKKEEPEKFEKCVKSVKKKTGYADNKKGKKKTKLDENTLTQQASYAKTGGYVNPQNKNIAPSTTSQTQNASYAKTGGFVNPKNNIDDPYIKLKEIKDTTQDPNLKKQLESILAQRDIEKLKDARDEQPVQQNNAQVSSPQM
jgi:hypothetical protein